MSECRNMELRWERVGDTFDLKVVNTANVNVGELSQLLEDVARDRPDFRKPFSRDATEYFREWLRDPEKNPLCQGAYCLLSNWFLTSSPARKSTRAGCARALWKALFRIVPKRRLTDPKNNRKALPDEFRRWWRKERRT
jgi:hypothetical protein